MTSDEWEKIAFDFEDGIFHIGSIDGTNTYRYVVIHAPCQSGSEYYKVTFSIVLIAVCVAYYAMPIIV